MANPKEENGRLTPKTERSILQKKLRPPYSFPMWILIMKKAKEYVRKIFQTIWEYLAQQPLYPTNFEATAAWLHQFFEHRFMEFGAYEDAIVAENSILNHSVLTPMLNVGLITPQGNC